MWWERLFSTLSGHPIAINFFFREIYGRTADGDFVLPIRHNNTADPASKTVATAFAQLMASHPANRFEPIARTISGPMICPAANPAVIRPSNTVGLAGIISRAICKPAIVATIKVPPTSTEHRVIDHKELKNKGSSVPIAMLPCASAHNVARGQLDIQPETAATDKAAANPKIGHASPNTCGSDVSCLAMVGRNVAGIMYPRPKML